MTDDQERPSNETAVRRRRARWSAGAAAVLGGAVAAALTVGGSSHGTGTAPPQARLDGSVHTVSGPHGSVQLVADTAPYTARDPSQLDAVVTAEQRLSLALLDRVGTGSNVTVSPASLYLALGMLQNGARGQTADQISHVLQADGLATDDQNAGLAGLMSSLAAGAAKDGIQLDSANSLWQQHGFPVRPQFLDALAAYYRSGVYQVDFAGQNSEAAQAINQWTSDNTHGKIAKLFDSLDPSTVLVLANAIYFHAGWATPFDAALTSPGPFTTADGTTVPAKFMNSTGLVTAATDSFQAVRIPYRGGRFEALAVMPTAGSLADFVAGLTPGSIASIASATQAGRAVSLPRFTTTSTLDLKPVLSALGMGGAFLDSADFSGLSAESTKVDQVVQRAYVSVGEKGTTAAAATGISMVPTSVPAGPPPLVFDHPFVFLVRDTQTGAILFASEITNPAG